MTLQQLVQPVRGAVITGEARLEITGLAYHSQRVQPGSVFFAIRGFREDGARYIAESLARGARAIVSEQPPDPALDLSDKAWVQVPAIRLALAQAACELFEHPSRELDLIGVTGTNGKTTSTFLIASILEAAGRRPALLGTIENRLRFADAGQSVAASQTTPESLDLQQWLRRTVEIGGRAAVMEVSSHSLALERVTGARFHTAVWTNFARDHLDFHSSVEDYFAAKKKLLLSAALQCAVLNADDERYAAMRESVEARVIRFALNSAAEVSARKWKTTPQGIEMSAETPAGAVEVTSRLCGRHNVYNLLAAIGAATALEISSEAIQAGLAEVTVPGRLEAITEGQPFAVLVDYAHTEEALRAVLAAAREMTPEGALILVFGCGGDRDRSKRPAMGLAAAAGDRVVLTSDNPRSEDPLQIINDVQVGLQKGGANYLVEPDRAAAIGRALSEARPGDTVLIAGKGHETVQIVGSERLPFDDRATARAALRNMGYGK